MLTLITHAAQLVTPPGKQPRIGAEMSDLLIIEDGALLARDGIIEAVGPTDEILRRAAQAQTVGDEVETIDASGGVVLPGFVDAHTHPVFAGTREDEYEQRARGASYEEIAAAGGGIRATVRKTRAASEDELVAAGARYARWFLTHGTTTVEAKSGYGLSVDDELKLLRAIKRLDQDTPLDYVPTFLGAHEVPDEYRMRRAEYVALVINQMLPRVAAEKLAEFCDVFCEPSVFTLEETRRICRAAQSLGLGIRLHADQLTRNGGAELAAEIGAVSADHLEQIDEAGIAALQRVRPRCAAVLLPASVFNLGKKIYPPARRLIEAGVPVALATDFNPGSSPTPSMQLALSLACTQMQMTPAEAITAATINAACSLGRGERIGSLTAGAQADAVVYDCATYRQIPYFAGVNHARAIVKRGRLVEAEMVKPRGDEEPQPARSVS
jgi:imidazolonepropionase